jgi:hypothetical protein
MRKTTRQLILNALCFKQLKLSESDGGSIMNKSINEQRRKVESMSELLNVIDLLTDYICRKYKRPNQNEGPNFVGHILEKVRVVFSEEVNSIEAISEFSSSYITIRVPYVVGESEDAQEFRRRNIVRDFIPSLKSSNLSSLKELYHWFALNSSEEAYEEFLKKVRDKVEESKL